MNVTEAETIAEKYNLVPIIRDKFSKESLSNFTEILKGFRPREEDKERTQEEWYNKYKSRISKLKHTFRTLFLHFLLFLKHYLVSK